MLTVGTPIRIKTAAELRATPGVTRKGEHYHHAETRCYFNHEMLHLCGTVKVIQEGGRGTNDYKYLVEGSSWVFYPWMFEWLPTNQGDD